MEAPPDLGLTLGAVELGVLLSSTLWGFSCVQTYIYVSGASRDGALFKLMVAAVFTMESLHMIFIWAYFYDMTVTHFGDRAAIAAVPWTFNAAFVMHTTISAIVQAFFSYRIWVLSGRVWLALPAWAVALARVGFSMTAVALLAQDGIHAFKAHHWLGSTALIMSMTVDIYNTAALVYLLYRAKDGVFSGTSRIIDKVLVLTMETGAAVVIVAVFGLASWIRAPSSALWIGAILVYARLYSNSLLATLNARHAHARGASVREHSDPSATLSFSGGQGVTELGAVCGADDSMDVSPVRMRMKRESVGASTREDEGGSSCKGHEHGNIDGLS